MAIANVPLWRRLWSVGWLVILLLAAIVANLFYKKDNLSLQNRGNELCVQDGLCLDSNGAVTITGYNTSFTDALIVFVKFAGVDTNALKVFYRLTVWGNGKYDTNLGNVTFVGGDTTVQLTPGIARVGVDVTASALKSVAAIAPMDEYVSSFSIFAFEGTPSAKGRYIPIGYQFQGGKGAWNVLMGISETLPAPSYSYTLDMLVKRSGTTKFVSILSAVVQGMVTLVYLLITTGSKKIHIAMIHFGIFLLFGLPSLGTSPATMIIVTLGVIGPCVIFNMFKYVYQISPPSQQS
ncbi:hypothetical protein HDU93_007089 [Gonapodya sp. JEL0774]|nr:hypothetical protein HDU93_007089 [Gonapodya sp. JEL0774]